MCVCVCACVRSSILFRMEVRCQQEKSIHAMRRMRGSLRGLVRCIQTVREKIFYAVMLCGPQNVTVSPSVEQENPFRTAWLCAIFSRSLGASALSFHRARINVTHRPHGKMNGLQALRGQGTESLSVVRIVHNSLA